MKNRINQFKISLGKSPGVSLALGGGGSKGIAHIGLLRVLEREKIKIEALAGSSIGGLIAAVYAVGNDSEKIMHLLGALQFSNLLRHGGKVTDALISLDGIAAALENILGDKSFKDLEVPLALTALDMLTGHEIILREGRLLDAVLATIAIPGIFPIQKMNGYELVDGGLSNPVPIAIARSLSPYSPVIACVLSQSLQQASSANGNGAKPNVVSSLPIPGALIRFRLGRSFAAFMNALAVSGRVQTELRIGFEKPDILIRPSVEEIGLLENVDVADLVTRGERATEIVMPDIKRALRRARWSMMVPRKTGRAS